MPVDITARVSGLQEFEAAMQRAKNQAVKTYIRRAAKKAADIWVNAIVEKAPRDSGFLADNINVVTAFKDSGSRLEMEIGPVSKAFYALFQEFGTRFQEAHPFMRPAFEEHKEEVLEAFAEAIGISLQEVAA